MTTEDIHDNQPGEIVFHFDVERHSIPLNQFATQRAPARRS